MKKIIIINLLMHFWFIIEAQKDPYCYAISQIVIENTLENSDNFTVDCFPAFKPDGKYLFYYPPNQQDSNQRCLNLAMVGNYKKGVPHGVWLGYYVNGNAHWMVSFDQGCFSGSFQYFYPNGNLMHQGTYCQHCIDETQIPDAVLTNICMDGFQLDMDCKSDSILGKSISWQSISTPPSIGYNLFFDNTGVLRSEKFLFDCYGNGWEKQYFTNGQLNSYKTYRRDSCFTHEVYLSNGNQIVRDGRGKEINYSHDSLNIYVTDYVNGIAKIIYEFDTLLRLSAITKYNENKNWSRLEIDLTKGFCFHKKYILEDGMYYERKRFSLLIGIRKQTITAFLKKTLK